MSIKSYDEYVKARGLRWPVVEGKETRWRYREGFDPYVKAGTGWEFYGKPDGNLDGRHRRSCDRSHRHTGEWYAGLQSKFRRYRSCVRYSDLYRQLWTDHANSIGRFDECGDHQWLQPQSDEDVDGDGRLWQSSYSKPDGNVDGRHDTTSDSGYGHANERHPWLQPDPGSDRSCAWLSDLHGQLWTDDANSPGRCHKCSSH